MRLALVGAFPLHPTSFEGGVETSTWNLIEGLQTFGEIEIHVVTCNKTLRKTMCVKRSDATYHYLPSPGRFQTLSLYLLDRLRIHKKLFEINPDVVHAQSAQSYGYICLKTAFPVAISIHGIVQEEAKYIFSPKDRLRAMVRSKLIQKYCVQNARHIIQPTRYPEQYFGDLKTGTWHDTGNAVAAKFFDIKSETEKGRLLYSGAIIPRKRLLDLIKALSKVKKIFPTVSLRVAGGTPDKAYLQKVKEWITTLGLEANVTFLGLLTQAELAEEYKKCTLLVLPSGQETSPMVIAEIMAVGKPVVATRVGGVPFLVDDGQTGFVEDVGDIDALASSIVIILSDDELQSKMRTRTQKKADLNFRSRVVAAKVRQVYRQVIDSYA